MSDTPKCSQCDIDHRRGAEDCPAHRIGKLIAGKYRLESLMGVGGMGAVYKATHISLGTKVAIKMIHARFAANELIAKRFDKEAQRVAMLRHPGIVKVSDLGRDTDGSPYLEMELLDGTPVDELLRNGRLPLDLAADITQQTLEALQYAHEQGIIHRDLKPENLFLVGTQVKILDFGIAKAMQDSGPSMTKTGSIMGTPLYMSPEQLTDAKNVDVRTDIYAMGATLYELLTAKHTVNGTTYPELISNILQGEVSRTPRHHRPELSRAVDNVVVQALAHHPGDRFESASAMLSALRAAIEIEKDSENDPRFARTQLMAEDAENDVSSQIQTTDDDAFASQPRPAMPTVPADKRKSGKPLVLALGGVAIALGVTGGLLSRGDSSSTNVAVSHDASQLSDRADGSLVIADAAPRNESPAGMRSIAAAEFTMGSNKDEVEAGYQLCRSVKGDECPRKLYEREQPIRSMRVSAFFLDATEVTAAKYAAALNAAKATVTGAQVHITDVLIANLARPYTAIAFSNNAFAAVRERQPMAQVTWDGADWYCKSIGKRLPTEAEWERAARGTTGRMYPWGNQVSPSCSEVAYGREDGLMCADNTTESSDVATSPTDVTPEGVYDLGGNVTEWVADDFRDRYDGSCHHDCLVLSSGGDTKVIRGGNFHSAPERLRSAGRSRDKAQTTDIGRGFRCAKDK